MIINFKNNFLGKKKHSFEIFFRRLPLRDKYFLKYKHPWNNQKKLSKAYNYGQVIEEKILDQVTIVFNDIFSENNSKDYWRIILSSWLTKFVSFILETEAIVNDLKKKIDYVEISNLEFSCIISESYQDFINKSDEDFFRKILILIIIKHKKIKIKGLKNNFILKEQKTNIVKNNLFIDTYNSLAKFFFKDFYIVDQLSINTFYNSFKMKRVPLCINKYIAGKRFDKNKRKKIQIKIFSKDKFITSSIKELFNLLLPKSYFENYHLLKKDLRLKNSTIISDGLHIHSDIVKIFIANFKKVKSNKYFILQHGGGYLCKYHSSHELELKTADVFYSWGKPIAKNEKQSNSPHIKNFVNISKLLDDKIIIPLYFPRKYTHNMTSIIGGKQYEENLSDLYIFLRNLNADILKKITLRLPPSEKHILDFIKFIKNKFPNINISHGKKSFKEDLKRYSLFVTNTYATTLLQASTSNIPMIFFWRKNHYRLNQKTDFIFNQLKKKKIFYHSPVNAAQFINKHYYKILSENTFVGKKILRKKFNDCFCCKN